MLQAFLELRSLQQVFDAATGVLEDSLGAPVCIRKCGYCCINNTPMASIMEGINLVSINAFQSKKLKKLVEVAEGWLLEPHNNTVYKGVPFGFQAGEIMEDWTRTVHSQCPYMEENKDCILYENRPLVCRAYGVFRDVEGCPRPLGKGESTIRHAIIDSDQVRPLVKEFYDSCASRQPVWAIRCFIPTVIFRAANPEKFQEYIADNKIASAKLLGMDIDTSLMWQPQLDELRKGSSPDEVIMQDVLAGRV